METLSWRVGPLTQQLTPMTPHEVTFVQHLVQRRDDCSVKDAAELLLSLRDHRRSSVQSTTSDDSSTERALPPTHPTPSKYIPHAMDLTKPLFDIPPPLSWGNRGARRARGARGDETANQDDDEDYVVEEEEDEDEDEDEEGMTGVRPRASSGGGSADGIRLRRLGFYTLSNVRQVFHLPEEAACAVRGRALVQCAIVY